MDINEMIAKMGGLKAIASRLGVSEQDVEAGAAALAPALVGGFERQATPPADLLNGDATAVPDDVSRGNGLLASIFGSKDVSRAVAKDASTKSGINSATLKKMLPIVAMMVASYMAKRRQSGGRGS